MTMLFTPLDCERALSKRISWYTQDMIFRNPQERIALPKAPSVAVKAGHGQYIRLDGWVTMMIKILTWDDNLNRNGYRDTLNIVNRIISGIQDEVVLDNSFMLQDHPIEFELIEDPAFDYYSYFLGMILVRYGLMSYGPADQPLNEVGPDTSTIVVNKGIVTGVTDPTVNPPPLSREDLFG